LQRTALRAAAERPSRHAAMVSIPEY